MKSPELWMIVVPPSEATAEMQEAVQAAADAEPEFEFTWRTVVRTVLSRVLHPVGAHHWVRYRTFDLASKRIIEWPNTWVCARPGCRKAHRSR